MNQKETAIQNLQEFVAQASKLSREWNTVLDTGYPLPQSFNEQLDDMIMWYIQVQQTHGTIEQRLSINYGIILTEEGLVYTTSTGDRMQFQFVAGNGCWRVVQVSADMQVLKAWEVADIYRWIRSQLRKAIRSVQEESYAPC